MLISPPLPLRTCPLPSTLPVTKQREELVALLKYDNICYSAYRHIIVLEVTYQRLFPFIPCTIRAAKGLSCNPLPLPTAVTAYDDDFFQGTRELVDPAIAPRRQRAALQRRMEQAIPDPAFLQQFHAFFEAHPQLAEHFPGGIFQFTQMIKQLPPDAVEDIFLGAGAGVFGMPGQMPGFESQMQEDIPVEEAPHPMDTDNDAGEDEDESENDVSPMPRIVRQVTERSLNPRPTTKVAGMLKITRIGPSSFMVPSKYRHH